MALVKGSDTLPRIDNARILPLDEGAVTRCLVDAAFSLEVLRGSEYIHVRIEVPFGLLIDGNRLTIDPDESVSVGPALGLLRKTVVSATAFETGRLLIVFSDRAAISVDPDPDYEAWQFTSNKGLKIVCTPGGGLAIWNPIEPAA